MTTLAGATKSSRTFRFTHSSKPRRPRQPVYGRASKRGVSRAANPYLRFVLASFPLFADDPRLEKAS